MMRNQYLTAALLAGIFASMALRASADLVVPDEWTAEGYQYNMTFYAQVLRADNTQVDNERSVLAAFDASGKCRGSISPIDGPTGSLYQLGIASDSAEEPNLVLKVLDALTGETYLIQETVDFVSDAIVPADGIVNPRQLHVAGKDVSLLLKPGWNLMALARPVTMESLANLLPLSPMQLDAGGQTYVRCTSPEDFQFGVGYWFFSPKEQRIELTPDLAQTSWDSTELSQGWNLVGTSQDAPGWLPLAKCMYLWDVHTYRYTKLPAMGVWVYRE